jgi:hypothetical protein
LQCPRERLLHHVFGQREVLDAKNARQRGNHLPGLVPEKMFDHPGNFCRRLRRW